MITSSLKIIYTYIWMFLIIVFSNHRQQLTSFKQYPSCINTYYLYYYFKIYKTSEIFLVKDECNYFLINVLNFGQEYFFRYFIDCKSLVYPLSNAAFSHQHQQVYYIGKKHRNKCQLFFPPPKFK